MFPRGDHRHCLRSDRPRSYERASIVEWLQKHDTSPATGFPSHFRGRLHTACTPLHALSRSKSHCYCPHDHLFRFPHPAISGGKLESKRVVPNHALR